MRLARAPWRVTWNTPPTVTIRILTRDAPSDQFDVKGAWVADTMSWRFQRSNLSLRGLIRGRTACLCWRSFHVADLTQCKSGICGDLEARSPSSGLPAAVYLPPSMCYLGDGSPTVALSFSGCASDRFPKHTIVSKAVERFNKLCDGGQS